MPPLPTPTGQIQTPGLIWCEGPNDFAFLRRLIVGEGLTSSLRVEVFEGKENLSTYLEILRLRPGFSGLNALGIVRDADELPSGALRSVRDLLMNQGLPCPDHAGIVVRGPSFDGRHRAAGVFIAPDGESPGALESLYLRAIGRDAVSDCVQAFMHCVIPHLHASLVAHRAKVEFHTWLASRERPGILPGQAMDANYIVRDHPAFDPIKAFLRELATAAETPAE
ncbi:MAG: hypothetical protein IT306_03015 [Chloroflexi bacterium]|nr:hypothetical protein [Chloroflexota bacterium]